MDGASLLDLVKQIQAGVRLEENFGILFRRFRPLVHAFFIRKGSSAEESRDLTQEVFFRVFKGIDTFRHEARFERWLWEIADHIYLNELRKWKTDKRHGVEHSLDLMMENDNGSSQPMELPAQALSPEERVLRQQDLVILRSAFQELPDKMRWCCTLRYEKGLKYKEIADEMKVSIETVKAHLHQARNKLTARLMEKSASKGVS